MDLVFGSYNLEHGGIDNGDATRLHRQLKMLAGTQADAWAFQECSHWRDNGALDLAEQTLNMRGYIARSARHPGGDLAVFVRESRIRVTGQSHEEKPPYWHGVAHLITEADGLGPLRLASAHLAPSDPSLRVTEAESFALIADRPGPLIAGGDWNTVPLYAPDPDADGMPPGSARRKTGARAARALAEHMTDVGGHVGDGTPTVGHRRPGQPAYRCDRIYTTLPASAITGYQVIREASPESDHRPVLATFTI